MYCVSLPDKECYVCVQLTSILLGINDDIMAPRIRHCILVAHVPLCLLMRAALYDKWNDFGLPTSNIYLYAWTSKNTTKHQREWHYFLTSSVGSLLILLPCTHFGRARTHTYACGYRCIFILLALRPNTNYGFFIHEVSRSHTMTHHSQ
jgi:hypothetical protein